MNAEEQGRKIGMAMADAVKRLGLADAARGIFQAIFGACSRCDAALSGHSPSQLCAECHAAIVLKKSRCTCANGPCDGECGYKPSVEA